MWNQQPSPVDNRFRMMALSLEVLYKANPSQTRDKIESLILAENHVELIQFTLPDYEEPELSVLDFLYIRQCLAFYSKNASLDIGVDCEQVARETWIDTERVCRETNRRFRAMACGDRLNQPSPHVASVLYAAQCKIAKVLGPNVPSLKELELQFGPGATRSVKKKDACARTKLSARPSCSTNMLPLLPALFDTLPLYAMQHVTEYTEDEEYVIAKYDVEIADGALGFVPKNAKTHRTVLVEPHLNGLVQGGYGKYITRRLRGVGIDLSNQGRNKLLAREGSLTGALATLDLSSASDLISKEVVASLLPYDWWSALLSCRTPIAIDGKDSYVLEKFSSMGNGFTFPLQTLLFWALCTACQEDFEHAKQVSVYGDDIIVPVGSVDRVLEVFAFCGFKVNSAKSYWRGPFRESCGGDYYNGVNIRPLYIKDALSYKTLFVLHNYYYRNGEFELAAGVRGFISDDVAIYGPDGYGDGHLLGDWSPVPHGRTDGWSGYLFDTYVEYGRKHKKFLPGDYILPAYSVYVNTSESWDDDEWDDWRWKQRPKFTAHNTASLPFPKSKSGIPHLSLPGADKYKRVTLYTLSA